MSFCANVGLSYLETYRVFNNDCTPSTAKTSKTLAKRFLYYNSLNKVTLLCKVSDWCVECWMLNLKKYKLLTYDLPRFVSHVRKLSHQKDRVWAKNFCWHWWWSTIPAGCGKTTLHYYSVLKTKYCTTLLLAYFLKEVLSINCVSLFSCFIFYEWPWLIVWLSKCHCITSAKSHNRLHYRLLNVLVELVLQWV